jgi:hypothetical protein
MAAEGRMSETTYGSMTRTIAAGTEERFDISGSFLRCLVSSHSDFRLRVGGGAPQYFDQGLKYVAEAGEGFEYVSIINDGASALTLTLGFGFGDLDDDRLSLVGGSLPVEPSASNPPFKVEPSASNPAFKVEPSASNPPFKVEQTGYLNTEGGVIRQLKGTRKHATSMAAGAYSTIFTSAENVNGAIVHFMTVWSGTATGSIQLVQSTNTQAVYGGAAAQDVPAFFVPAGEELIVYSSVAGGQYFAHVELL